MWRRLGRKGRDDSSWSFDRTADRSDRTADWSQGTAEWSGGRAEWSGGRARGSRRRRVSLGASLTGLMVALSATFVFTVLAGAALQSQGHDLHKVVQGRTPWASPGAGTAFVLAVFLSFLWGGYTAGRMGAGAGGLNGGLVPGIALIVIAALTGFRLGVQGRDIIELPFGVGNLPLDANFTPLGIAVVAGVAVSLLAGGIWGGIIGARWHMRLDEEYEAAYEATGGEPFTDLLGRPSRY